MTQYVSYMMQVIFSHTVLLVYRLQFQCSASCGEATRVRTIMCIEDKTSGTNLLDFRECPADSRPIDAEPCKLPDCLGKYPSQLHVIL